MRARRKNCISSHRRVERCNRQFLIVCLSSPRSIASGLEERPQDGRARALAYSCRAPRPCACADPSIVLIRARAASARDMNALLADPAKFAALIQRFFAERLLQQQAVSARTVAAYRDAFRLLLVYAERRLGKPPAKLTWATSMRS